MLSIKTFLNGWNDFFYKKTDASPLAIFRIALGFFLFLNGISMVEDFGAWFGVGTNALVPLQDSLTYYSNFRFNIFKWLSPTEAAAWFVLITYIISSLCMMVGFKTKIATVVSYLLLVSIQNRNYSILNSGDTLMRCMHFLMIFAPTYVKYSIDAWIKKKSGVPYSTEISYVTIRLLQLQFTTVYLATTLFKLKGYDWVDGTAVYYTSRLINFQRFALPLVFDYVVTVKFLTWTALFIEFAMGTLIWIKEFRLWVLLSGIILHLGIEVSMSIGFFEWVMMAAYVLFLEPSDIFLFKKYLRIPFFQKSGTSAAYRP